MAERGADFHPDLQPEETDTVLLPHKGTDVFHTDLPDHLERLGTTHLVIAGMTANLCCESTGRHAAEAGYDVTYISDAMGSENLPSYEAAIHVNFPLIGNAVMTVDDFFSTVDAGTEGAATVQPGDRVRGSDHGEIGSVEEVTRASGDTDAYMRVPRGAILQKDTYIPMDAVTHRSETTVFVNVPKLVVGKMPWGEPPNRSDWRSKVGPKAESVEKLYRSRSPSGVVAGRAI